VDADGLIKAPHGLVEVGRLEDVRACVLPRGQTQSVDAQAPGELSDPRSDRFVVSQRFETLVRARENLLEDVFCVVLGQAKCLRGNGVHVARKSVYEFSPRRLVAAPAAGDEAGVGDGGKRHSAQSNRISSREGRSEPR
jgi:hypothetical protein